MPARGIGNYKKILHNDYGYWNINGYVWVSDNAYCVPVPNKEREQEMTRIEQLDLMIDNFNNLTPTLQEKIISTGAYENWIIEKSFADATRWINTPTHNDLHQI